MSIFFEKLIELCVQRQEELELIASEFKKGRLSLVDMLSAYSRSCSGKIFENILDRPSFELVCVAQRLQYVGSLRKLFFDYFLIAAGITPSTHHYATAMAEYERIIQVSNPYCYDYSVGPENYPLLDSMVADLAVRAGIAKPKVSVRFTSLTKSLNAVKTYCKPDDELSYKIVIELNFLCIASIDEMRALLAHEIGHIVLKHFSQNLDRHEMEFQADNYAVDLSQSKDHLIAALCKAYACSYIPFANVQNHPALECFDLSTHPALEARIAKINAE